jgi:hypothetical protein
MYLIDREQDYPPDEIAIRFHQAGADSSFPNGNGRHARLLQTGAAWSPAFHMGARKHRARWKRDQETM